MSGRYRTVRNQKRKSYGPWRHLVKRVAEFHKCDLRFEGDADICNAFFTIEGEHVAYLYAEWDGVEGYVTDNSDNPSSMK